MPPRRIRIEAELQARGGIPGGGAKGESREEQGKGRVFLLTVQGGKLLKR
jgi:hypothetical protein